jgi:hypothetical protein
MFELVSRTSLVHNPVYLRRLPSDSFTHSVPHRPSSLCSLNLRTLAGHAVLLMFHHTSCSHFSNPLCQVHADQRNQRLDVQAVTKGRL